MSAELATREPNAEAIEQALVHGNLAALTSAQRVIYYNRVCESVGLNPLTKPFEYITLNGKLTLYAQKGCTDQLRTIRGISIEKPDITFQDDWIVVTVAAKDGTGRTDSDIGVVAKKDMQGNFGNALMKAVTKAKRRVTLSICGLGMLDETEVESIPAARTFTVEEAHGGEVVTDPKQIPGVKSGADLKPPIRTINFAACGSMDDLRTLWIGLTPAEKEHYADAKDQRKAALTEGEQSLPPSANGVVSGTTADRSAVQPANTATEPDAAASANSDPLPKAPKKLTANYISDLIAAVADGLGADETHLIQDVCRAIDAPDIDTASPDQLQRADKWLRERATVAA